MYWPTSRNSKLSIEYKLKIYKTIVKPIWTYGIPLRKTAATSHINKLESLQSKILRTIANVPWYVRNEDVRKESKIPTAKEEIGRYAEKYKQRTTSHPKQLAAEASKTLIGRRLKRRHPTDLAKENLRYVRKDLHKDIFDVYAVHLFLVDFRD